MSFAFATGIFLALGVIGVIAYLFKKIAFRDSLPVTAEWICELSADRYRPMLRLLDGDDLNFLRSQPGFTPAMARRVRAQRIQLFRSYLKSLENDFNQVCSLLKMILTQSDHDRPDLAGLILRNRITFVVGMLRIRATVALYSWGFCSVEVSQLVRLFDVLRVEVRALVPCEVGAAA